MSRIHQSSSVSPLLLRYTVNTAPPTVSASNKTASYLTVIRDDVRRSGLPKTAWRPPMPYAADIREMTTPRGKVVRRYFDGSTTIIEDYDGCFGDQGLSVRAHPGYSTGLRSRTEVKALLKLKDQDINLAQAFAERRQTVGLLYNAADTVLNGIRGLRRGNIPAFRKMLDHYTPKRALREGSRATKKLANRWLENAYGWTPAMSDFHGAVDALGKAHDSGLKLPIVTVKAGSTTRERGVREAFHFGPMLFQDFETQRCFVRLDFIEDNPFEIALSKLGLTNPALLAWELIPFSFVVDWFYPAGNWLNSLDATRGWKFQSGSVSQVCQLRQQMEYKGGKINSSVSYTGSWYNKPVYRTKTMRRLVYASSPFPRPPAFKSPVSTSHVLNALSLMRAMMNR